MSVDEVISVLIEKWDDWRAEADSEAQHQQDPVAGESIMREKIRPLLQREAQERSEARRMEQEQRDEEDYARYLEYLDGQNREQP